MPRGARTTRARRLRDRRSHQPPLVVGGAILGEVVAAAHGLAAAGATRPRRRGSGSRGFRRRRSARAEHEARPRTARPRARGQQRAGPRPWPTGSTRSGADQRRAGAGRRWPGSSKGAAHGYSSLPQTASAAAARASACQRGRPGPRSRAPACGLRPGRAHRPRTRARAASRAGEVREGLRAGRGPGTRPGARWPGCAACSPPPGPPCARR